MEVKTFQNADNGYIVRGVCNKGNEKFFSLSDIALLFGYKKGLNFIPKAMAKGVKKVKIEIPDKKGRLQPMAFIAEKDILKILSTKRDIAKYSNQINFMKDVSEQLAKLALKEPAETLDAAPTKSVSKKNMTIAKKTEKKLVERKAAKTALKKDVEKAEKKEVKKEAAKAKAENKTAKTEAGNKEQPKRQYMSVSGFAAMIMQLVNKQNLVIVPDEAMKANG